MEPGAAVILSMFSRKPVTTPTEPSSDTIRTNPSVEVASDSNEPVVDFDTGVLLVPDGRAGIARWIEYATRLGFDEQDLAHMTKAEVRNLVAGE
jgi:hypothetical protein